MILGATVFYRTYHSDSNLRNRVPSIWGGPHEQRPPDATAAFAAGRLPLEKTRITTSIDLDYRQKGLVWYNTYKVNFQGAYTFRNKTEKTRRFPSFFRSRL